MIHSLALRTADAVADLLAAPDTAPPGSGTEPSNRLHLAYGPTGIALLHIERAAADRGPWQRAHDWLTAATSGPVTSGPDGHPWYGAPALAHALACAADELPGGYQRAQDTLHRQLVIDVRRRLDAAHRRTDAGRLPDLAEFDAIRGLAGYGAYFLRRDPAGVEVRAVLDYCVRLTRPVVSEGDVLPGWWTSTGPAGRADDRFPGGHANNGTAHGIAGVLALLALAARRGTTVSGHHEALRVILGWLDHWQETTGRGPVWPYWVTRADRRKGSLAPSPPLRPSWCYGTAGLARAQQLAALALGDADRQVEAENALLAALSDPAQLTVTTDNGLCHGFAGLAHVATRTAADAHPSTAGQLREVATQLLRRICPASTDPQNAARAIVQDEDAGQGLLDGAAGIALGLLAPATATSPLTAWDTCLLVA